MRFLPFALIGIAACAAPPPAESPRKVREAPSSPPLAAVSTPVVNDQVPLAVPTEKPPLTRCQQIGREQRATLRPYFDELLRFQSMGNEREAVAGWCLEDAKGAWAFELQDIEVQKGTILTSPFPYPHEGSFTGKLRLARLDDRGKHVAVTGWKQIPGHLVPTFDYDGDGVPELIVDHSYWEKELWTIRDGRVIPYPGTEKLRIRAFEDRDDDGRPDLIYLSPYSDATWQGEEVHFPEFMAHSLADGGFSFDDKVALRLAHQTCDDVPARLSPGDPYPASLFSVVCQRLRGVPEKTVQLQIRGYCKEYCYEKGVHLAWAHAEPPFRFPSP